MCRLNIFINCRLSSVIIELSTTTRDLLPATRDRQRLDTYGIVVYLSWAVWRAGIATVLHKLPSRCAVAITRLPAQNKP